MCMFCGSLFVFCTFSFGHCFVCSSMIYAFWLPLWYLLNIVLSVLLWYTDSDYTLGIFWPLCCLFFYDIRILITPLVSFDHCFVCSSMIYWFWLPLWYLLAIVLSVVLWYTDSDYPLAIFWPLCCLFFYDIRILITRLYLLAIVLSALLWYTHSDYPFVSFGHCVVCCSMIYGFWLPLRYLQTLLNSIFGFATRSIWFILCSHFKCII